MNKQKLAAYFFRNPTARLRVRQIERATELPLPSVTRYVKELIEEDILALEEIAGVRFYRAAQSTRYRRAKQLFNLGQLYESGLVDYFEKLGANVILFGSYSRGEDTEESDIDLYVESPEEPRNLERYERFLRKELQIFRHSDVNQIENKYLANNILNGITLAGTVNVFEGEELGKLSQELRDEIAEGRRESCKGSACNGKGAAHISQQSAGE